MEDHSRVVIKNNSLCLVCGEWFDEKERAELVRIGDEEKGYIDLHKECIEPAFAMGLIYHIERPTPEQEGIWASGKSGF